MSNLDDWNARIIEEFRANDGVVGGPFAGMELCLVHHVGRRTGTERVAPLAVQRVGDDLAVFGSKAGATTHPDWFHNLVATPDTVVEIGTETRAVRARVTEGEEREAIWTHQKETVPTFAEYEEKAGDREIPVILLEAR